MRVVVMTGLVVTNVVVLSALYPLSLWWGFSVTRQYLLFPVLVVFAELILIVGVAILVNESPIAQRRHSDGSPQELDDTLLPWPEWNGDASNAIERRAAR